MLRTGGTSQPIRAELYRWYAIRKKRTLRNKLTVRINLEERPVNNVRSILENRHGVLRLTSRARPRFIPLNAQIGNRLLSRMRKLTGPVPYTVPYEQ